jgi:hypothetical protein
MFETGRSWFPFPFGRISLGRLTTAISSEIRLVAAKIAAVLIHLDYTTEVRRALFRETLRMARWQTYLPERFCRTAGLFCLDGLGLALSTDCLLECVERLPAKNAFRPLTQK